MIAEIFPNVFLGDFASAADAARLRSLGISSVLSCGHLHLPWCSDCRLCASCSSTRSSSSPDCSLLCADGAPFCLLRGAEASLATAHRDSLTGQRHHTRATRALDESDASLRQADAGLAERASATSNSSGRSRTCFVRQEDSFEGNREEAAAGEVCEAQSEFYPTPQQAHADSIEHLLLSLEDREDEVLLPFLPLAIHFIRAALQPRLRAPVRRESQLQLENKTSDNICTSLGARERHIQEGECNADTAKENATAAEEIVERGAAETRALGRVLIHCHEGISRSSAVAVAFLLATAATGGQKEGYLKGESADSSGEVSELPSVEAILARVCAVYPAACPNSSFRAQLSLFARLRCSLQGNTPEHRAVRLALVGRKRLGGGDARSLLLSQGGDTRAEAGIRRKQEQRVARKMHRMDGEAAAQPAVGAETEITLEPREGGEAESSRAPEGADGCHQARCMYACRLCRRVLFADEHIVAHNRTDKAATKGIPLPSQQKACNMVFVEPMDWMESVREISGKIICPTERCKAKLGVWSWHGLPCNCGTWQSPAFQIQLRRVDKLPRDAGADDLQIQGIL
ncbi:hypothetical protein BESB_037100 [Besnoitia besnoiti]|uniref:protein-tyrosine-phosphatase n=1 Tax=Besnoitia besnoiti TaxID=94643 RepID=A0A2A9MNJ3_BESBE|nr:hypothetical protein BESB_037100 [Besnoitia besnoiti]PFH37252.1 hypothetical protein BESB_037100 [Besnoitia besnoiti]